MPSFKTVLLVSKEVTVIDLITQFVSKHYKLLKTHSEADALRILNERQYIDAIIIDACDTVIDVAELLKNINISKSSHTTPALIIINAGVKPNHKSLPKNAVAEFITTPLKEKTFLKTINNTIIKGKLENYNRLVYSSEYDTLTGILNRQSFYEKTRLMLDNNPDTEFMLARVDVSRFSLINSYYGSDVGDNLLKYIARNLKRYAKRFSPCTYGRIEGDTFAMCLPSDTKENISASIQSILPFFRGFNHEFDISPCFGIYIIKDPSIPVHIMLDKANLAAKNCKGNYMTKYNFYDEGMEQLIQNEQEIINEMNTALEEQQFVVYFQPKYSLYKRCISGAEALVRWVHPQKGIISPGDFIPVFEKNGFISKLDYYVWEQVCRYLRLWIDKCYQVSPVSVNVSRVDLYNPNFVTNICNLVDKYDLPHSLLNLELTESAYTDNPSVITNVIGELQEKGFVIFMDDFGSGYSSLNILKDINVDVLKLDMKFLSETTISGRGENIIASVIRMAKWLNIPTVAEGVEKKEQVNFLYEIGCDFAQGYYFAHPMPSDDYEKLIAAENYFSVEEKKPDAANAIGIDEKEMKKIFANPADVIAICEFCDDAVTLYRVTKGFNKFFNFTKNIFGSLNIVEFVAEKYREAFLNTFKNAVETKGTAECDYESLYSESTITSLHIKVTYKNSIGKRHILIAKITDVTAQKRIEEDLEMHKFSLLHRTEGINKMLIIDSNHENDEAFHRIFGNEYSISQVQTNEMAFETLFAPDSAINIILINVLEHDMDAETFMHIRNSNHLISDIPVVLITNDDSATNQKGVIELGANDYITKPFVDEIVLRRVNNVLFSHRHIKNKYSKLTKKS